MMLRPDNLVVQVGPFVAAAFVGTSMLLIVADAAWPQAAAPPPSLGIQEAPEQRAPQPSAPAENPGLIDEIGKFFDKSMSGFPSLKTPSQTIDDLNARARGAAKDAGDALSNLAKPSSMVAGRMACPVSVNGAPDCKAGADKLCQSKGYKEGKSLNTDSAESCSAKVLIPGRARKPGDCRTDNFVTSALCQ